MPQPGKPERKKILNTALNFAAPAEQPAGVFLDRK